MKGHHNTQCRSVEMPLHILQAQDCSHPQSQETAQDYTQSTETIQYSTPYFMSKEELSHEVQQPQDCTSLQTRSHEQSEHI